MHAGPHSAPDEAAADHTAQPCKACSMSRGEAVPHHALEAHEAGRHTVPVKAAVGVQGEAVRRGGVLLHCHSCTGLADLPHQGVLQHALVLFQEQDGPQHGQALLQRLHPEENQGACVGCHLQVKAFSAEHQARPLQLGPLQNYISGASLCSCFIFVSACGGLVLVDQKLE